jgi:hypothetical protein
MAVAAPAQRGHLAKWRLVGIRLTAPSRQHYRPAGIVVGQDLLMDIQGLPFASAPQAVTYE